MNFDELSLKESKEMQETFDHCRRKPLIPANTSCKQTTKLTNTAQRFKSGICLLFLLIGLKRDILWLKRLRYFTNPQFQWSATTLSFFTRFQTETFPNIHHTSKCIICDILGLTPVLFNGRYLQQAKRDRIKNKTF